MLKGNLSGFSLGEILQSLAINNHTGTLRLTAPDAKPKHIYCESGQIRFFSHGDPRTPRLGEILVRAGRLNREELQEALAEARASDKLVGRVLVERGYISQDDVKAALNMKIREELYELFTWEEGEFEFQLNHCPSDVFDALQKSVDVSIDINGVIMEGLRRVDEWELIHETIKTENEIYVVTGEEPTGSDATVQGVLPLFDGRKPCSELAASYAGPRFDLYKSICDLLESGAIRPLTVSELRSATESAAKERNYGEMSAFLRFATELSTEEPVLFVQLGDALTSFYQEKEAQQAYLSALRLCFDQGDWNHAASIADKLPPNVSLAPRDLQMLLQTFIELKLPKKALWAGHQLATALQREGEAHRAAEVLNSLISLDPTDLNLKVQIASLFQQVGETTRATEYYEDVAEALDSQKKVKDQIKILRVISELNPKRVEIKQKITTLVALQEKLERQRKRRITIAGVVLIGLLVVSVIPLLYELKARELFNHAVRMEQIAMTNGDFTQAKANFEELLKNYSMSTKVLEANLALQRIGSIERALFDTLKNQDTDRTRQMEEAKQILRNSILDALERAKDAEKRLAFEEAHAHYKEAIELGKLSMNSQGVQLPLFVQTFPKGAELNINGKVVGNTPYVYRYEPGESVEIKASLKGCEDVHRSLVLEDQHTLVYRLPRRPVGEFLLPGATTQELRPLDGDRLFVYPSRDGNIYAYDPMEQDIEWKRTVGKFGDRVSNLHVRGGLVYVGTVNSQVIALEARTGKVRWVAGHVRGPMLAAPSVSRNLRWVAVANLYGEVFVLDNRTGRRFGQFVTENEIVSSPVFTRGHVVAGSTDSHLYGYSLKDRNVSFIIELMDAVEIDPLVHGDVVVFATGDGRLNRLDTPNRRLHWSTRVTRDKVRSLLWAHPFILAATSTGRILAVDTESGSVEKQWEITDSEPGGMHVKKNHLYVGYENGVLAAWDLQHNELAWRWQAESSIQAKPLVLGSRVYIPSSQGTVKVLELLD
ncbi:MAG: PQQ-binding-like beta-propeller repeat protein [Planctomycetota bacterium]|nr:PQQ-binding-like beta-propeller repeat protein [Planctomycetota bacterium]